MRFRCGLAVVTAAVVPLVAARQPVQRDQAPFRTGVEHVSVPVVVTDLDDRPVPGLTRSDFEITAHGRPQAIATFEAIWVPEANRDLDAPAPEADVSVNTRPAATARQFAVIVDDLHIIESHAVPVKRLLTDFIKALSPDDEVAIVFAGRSDLSLNFTNSPGRMLETIDRVSDALGFGLDASPDRKGAAFYARSTLFTLRNAVATLANSRFVRRAIVYVSGGFAADVARNAELRSLLDDARRADVPIYALDPRGLVLADDAVRGWMPSSDRQSVRRIISGQQNTLAAIAINSGGRAFLNRSNLSEAVSQIVVENGSFYVLGFYPDPLLQDGKFHKISVRVRRRDVRVRAREGYWAPRANTGSLPGVPDALQAALDHGHVVPDLPLRVFAAPTDASGKRMTAVVTVEVVYPPASERTNLVTDTLHLNILALDPDARLKGSKARELTVKLEPHASNRLSFVANSVVDLPSRSLTLRVAVASATLSRLGAVEMALDALRASDRELQLSELVLGLPSRPHAAPIGGDSLDGVVPFQPTTARTFAAEDTLRVFARAFWQSDHTTAAGTLAIKGSTTTEPQTLTLTSSLHKTGHRSAVLDVTRSLRDLSPGEYVLEVSVQLPDGQRAIRKVPFLLK